MITADEILDALTPHFKLTAADPGERGSAPAETFLVDGGPARVGVIGSVTRPFCGDCDRVRLTADGQVRNCLFARDESNLRDPLRSRGQRRGAGRDLAQRGRGQAAPGTASTTRSSCSPPGRCPRSAADREGPCRLTHARSMLSYWPAAAVPGSAGRTSPGWSSAGGPCLARSSGPSRRPGRPGSSWSARSARPPSVRPPSAQVPGGRAARARAAQVRAAQVRAAQVRAAQVRRPRYGRPRYGRPRYGQPGRRRPRSPRREAGPLHPGGSARPRAGRRAALRPG